MGNYVRQASAEKKKSTLPLGRIGEDVATQYLEKLGHTVLERNWRTSHLEIDIITYDAEGIHIVEVKTLREPAMQNPQDNVNQLKRRRITKAARIYNATARPKSLSGSEIFFDIVAVTLTLDGRFNIEYFPKAWLPIYM